MAVNSVSIRPLNTHDLNDVIALWLKINISAHDFIASSYWQKHIDELRSALPKAHVKVAYLSSTIIGFIGIIEPHYIAGLFIDNAYQNQGVGSLLLNDVKQQYSQLKLHCYSKNIKAVSFYKKNGFSIVKETTNNETSENEYEMLWVKPK